MLKASKGVHLTRPLVKVRPFCYSVAKMRISMRKSGEIDCRGFTLMELIIVLLIIGLMAAYAVTSYGKSVESARLSQAYAVLGANAARLEGEYAKNNGWPAVWTMPPDPDFTFAAKFATPAVAIVSATRTGGVYLSEMTYTRRGAGDWCWGFSAAKGGSFTVNDTPIPVNRCCNVPACN